MLCSNMLPCRPGCLHLGVSLGPHWTEKKTLKFKCVGSKVPVCLVVARVYICVHARVATGMLPKAGRPLVVHPVNRPTKKKPPTESKNLKASTF